MSDQGKKHKNTKTESDHSLDQQSSEASEDHNLHGDYDNNLDYEPGGLSGCSIALGILCFPFTLLGSCFTVNEKEEIITLHYGKYTGTVQEPGCHWVNCWGRELIKVSKAKISVDLPNIKVVDKNGNPLVVSGIVVYHLVNIKKSNIDFQNAGLFVKNQSQATLKRIASRYPYEVEESETDAKLSLSKNADEITQIAKDQLQKQVAIAGVVIDSIQFNQISYAPEIAQGMLKKQQAMAMISARRTLVKGAVKIAYDAVDKLEDQGIKMNPKERTKLVSNLLTVTVAEEQVRPMLDLS
jgi:regulator of protease activity HflC (stomatin/prohibitin superfamily)